jgi:two-component sensor histidine kinase
MLRDRSITGQLFLFALAFGAPLLLLSGIIGWNYVRQEDRRLEDLAITQANTIVAQLENLLATYMASLKVLAVQPAVTSGNLEEVRAGLDRIGFEEGLWFTLRDRKGRQLVNTLAAPGEGLPVFSGKGDSVIFGKGKPYISNLIWAPVAQTWAVTLNAPVRVPAVTGDVRYAITVAVPATYFAGVLARTIPNGWVAAINDREGNIVARSLNHAEVVGKPMARQGWELTKDVPPGGSGLWNDIQNLEGTTVRGAYRRMDSTGWLIGVTALPEIYGAPRRNTHSVGAALAALALLLGTALATLMGRRITRAMMALQNKARAMRDMRTIDLPHTPLREVNAVAAIMRETTQVLRKREEQQTTLVQELNHRVKNTLATIQSISRLTLKNTPDPRSFDEAFSGRLMALSQTHNLLTETAWAGVELHELLATELKPFLTNPRVSLEGPTVNLSSKVAVALGMAVHELATNATKYGALNDRDGSIRVRWSVGNGLTLDWRETCGRPLIPPPPSKEGFGTRLIRQTIVRELHGSVEQRFEEKGLHVVITIPTTVEDRLTP